MARFTRSSFIDILKEDYVRTARAKGLGELPVVFKHGLRNALIPVVTMMGLQFGFLLAARSSSRSSSTGPAWGGCWSTRSRCATTR
jgi:ABC-type microcin C transport system permease subunit YejB